MKLKIIVFALAFIVLGIAYYQNQSTPSVGTAYTVAGQTYYLAGSGMSSTATSFTLTSFTIPQSSAKINDSQISDTFYMTVEPGSRSRQEIISCTTVAQNADGTATISGCTRGLSPMTPYTASTSLQFTHSGGSAVILSNPPQLYESVGFLENDEAITGAWTAITPTAALGIATKGYVDSVVNGGAITLDGIAPAAVAGETFATGTIVYFDTTQTEWMKADADVAASSTNVLLGIAQGPGTDGTAISGGVLTRGYDETNVGGTAGQTIYLSNTSGATSTSAGTLSIILGKMKSNTAFYFDPIQFQYANLAADQTFAGDNTFTGTTTFSNYVNGVSSSTYRVFTSSDTYTKPANLRHVIIEVVGGGGGSTSWGGGGSGGYCKELLLASELSATTSVTIGAGGTSGGGGGNSSFGSHCTGNGGGGTTSAAGGSAGGASGGDINMTGNGGGNGDSSEAIYGTGGGSFFGGGGAANTGSGGTSGNGGSGIVIVTEYF